MTFRLAPFAFATLLLAAMPAAQALTNVSLEWAGNGARAGVRINAFDDNTRVFGGLAHELSYARLASDGVAAGSFSAFSIEPMGTNSKRAQSYTQSLLGGTTGSLLGALYTTSYKTGANWNDTTQAAFQVAVWELTQEKPGLNGAISYDVGSGSFRTAGANAVNELAGSFISQTLAFTGTSSYAVYRLSSGSYQDLVTASRLSTDVTSPVPEPETYALFLAGLGVVGLLARRRLPR